MLSTPLVAVVVLNWNNAIDTLACLHSLAALDYLASEVLVIDNGSTDDSVARIRAAYPGVEIVETGANLGYAGGNNVGIRRALDLGAAYVLILNNDVTVSPEFLPQMLSVAESSPDVGVVTPLIADAARPAYVWAAGASIDWNRGEVHRLHVGEPVQDFQTKSPFGVVVAPGAAMLMKRSALERVGFLDETFFLYYEEADWCLSLAKDRFRILVAPSSLVWHRASATLGQSSPVTDYYMARNHLRFVSRHWSGLARARILIASVARQLLTIGAYTVRPHFGARRPNRNARLLGVRDALVGRSGKMLRQVELACGLEHT